MISRFLGPTAGMALAALAVSIPVTSVARADGPGYTYVGISYEWTDVKYGVNPKSDARYNNGKIEGENIDLSIGILPWLHVRGQAFGYADGTCNNCNTGPSNSTFDADIEGYKVGLGVNLGLDLIGLSENVDLVVRGNFIDVELSKLNIATATVSDDGWSGEIMFRGKISDRADVQIGYEYQDVGDVKNRDVTVGLNYRVFDGLSLLARGLMFDSETGLELGIRWQFGDLLFGGNDSIIN